jgi:hypothetical protein
MNAAPPREPQPWVRPERVGGDHDDDVIIDVDPVPTDDAAATDTNTLEEPHVDTSMDAEPSATIVGGGGWTIPLICIGMAIIACCVLVPAADENRRIAYETQRLEADLEQIKDQIQMNDQFLRRVSEDPSLSERLAQRQLKIIREGTGVLTLKGQATSRDMSPFDLVTLPPPPELPPYQPIGGAMSALCRHPRTRLYGLGIGMILVAAGLVLGYSKNSIVESSDH